MPVFNIIPYPVRIRKLTQKNPGDIKAITSLVSTIQ